jgi:serine/threonine-protein kinase
MRAEAGLVLADGRYQLISRIAVGGMGEVWRAVNLVNSLPVAVKVLRHEYTGDPVSLKRLRIEAHNASLLEHPHIATVLDYREQEGTGYLVMEYVDGQSLADVLANHSTIAPLRLLPILIQASMGLHAAHSAGVVHRDVKPGNILLGPGDHVKLTDFGISVAHGQMTLTDAGKVMGTAQYLAPEQALGNPATPAGDLYALGIIAYEALAGERPFTGVNHVAIALAQVREAPPPLPASVEESLANLVMSLLEKDPAARPPDGAALASHFSAVLDTHRTLAGRLLAARRDPTAPPQTGELPTAAPRPPSPHAFQLPRAPRTEPAGLLATNLAAESPLTAPPAETVPPEVAAAEAALVEALPAGATQMDGSPAPSPEAAREAEPQIEPPSKAAPVRLPAVDQSDAAEQRLDDAAPDLEDGAAVPHQTPRRPAYPPSPGHQPKAGGTGGSWVKNWLWPAIVGLFLVAIIVLGLFALFQSEPEDQKVGSGEPGTTHGAGHGIITLEYQVPTGASTER